MTPNDALLLILVVACAIAIAAAIPRLLNWHLTHVRLRLLTGTRPQRVALWVAVAPVLREFLPLLERTGLEVQAIVLLPTLSGSEGQSLLAEVEQVNGSTSFIVRLAHRLGGSIRHPEEVAGVLAEELLYLYRHAAAVTVVRQTSPTGGVDAAVQSATAQKPVGRNGLATLPRPAAQNEAEETVVPFRASPLGPRNNQGS